MGNECQQCFRIVLDREKLVCTAIIQKQSVAGADRIDHYDIRYIQQTIDIINRLIRRQSGGLVGIIEIFHPFRTQKAHMDHHGRGSRASIEAKKNWAGRRIFYIRAEIGIRKYGRDCLPLFVVKDIIFTDGVIRDLAASQFYSSFRGEAGGFKIRKIFCLVQSFRHTFHSRANSKS